MPKTLIFLYILLLCFLILFLILEYPNVKTKCYHSIIVHPLSVLFLSILHIFAVFKFFKSYNNPTFTSYPEPRTKDFMARIATLLCYKAGIIFYYLLVVIFIVFIIVGQLFLLNQSTECLSEFSKTLVVDYILCGYFITLILFGGFLLCFSMNFNSVDGCGSCECLAFSCNILSCGVLFRSRYEENETETEENQDMTRSQRKRKSKGNGVFNNFRNILKDENN